MEQTLTSQYTPSELYDLITDTISNLGSGANNAILTINNDIISIQRNGSILLEVIKEVNGENYVISKKEFDLYELFTLFELFENAQDNHLFKEDTAEEVRNSRGN